MSQPALKRPRVAFDDDFERKILLNHPTLYYDDGNVILRSKSTLFRVHRSILYKNSPVFRELFERREDTQPETLRGCMHIALDDSKEEVEALLNVIYDGFHNDFPELNVITFPTLANIYRMATKYRIDRARADILARIKEEWPFDLVKHDAKCAAKARALLQRQQQQPRAAPGGDEDAAFIEQEEMAVPPAAVIELLRAGGCADKDVLAPLFYALTCSTWQLGGPVPGHRIAQLSYADIERFVVGLEKLRAAFVYAAADAAALTTVAMHKGQCDIGVLHFWQTSMLTIIATKNTEATVRRPIEALKDVAAGAKTVLLAQGTCCSACADEVVAYLTRLRATLWASLPVYFGLA